MILDDLKVNSRNTSKNASRKNSTSQSRILDNSIMRISTGGQPRKDITLNTIPDENLSHKHCIKDYNIKIQNNLLNNDVPKFCSIETSRKNLNQACSKKLANYRDSTTIQMIKKEQGHYSLNNSLDGVETAKNTDQGQNISETKNWLDNINWKFWENWFDDTDPKPPETNILGNTGKTMPKTGDLQS